MNGPERSPCAVRPSASSRVRHASRLFGLLAAMVALAGHANGDQATPDLEYLLVRPTELPGLNLGWEFPGASGRVETADDPQRGPCHRVHYDLSKGGRYVRMEAACPPADVWAIRFALRRPTDAGQMFFAIRDATDQYFRGAIEVKGPDWQEMEIPLTEERFSAHHGGANDGRIHRPVRVVCIEMEAPEKVGEFVVDELRAVLDDPAPRVRRKAVRALGQIGQPSRAVLPQIQSLLKDSDDTVRKAAQQTLETIAPETLPPTKAKAAKPAAVPSEAAKAAAAPSKAANPAP